MRARSAQAQGRGRADGARDAHTHAHHEVAGGGPRRGAYRISGLLVGRSARPYPAAADVAGRVAVRAGSRALP